MNIIFFTDNFPPEGNAIASRVFERACYWIKWGHHVTIITSAPNFPEGKIYAGYKNKWYQVEIMEGIRVVRIKTYMAKNKGFILRTLDFLSYLIPAFIAGFYQHKSDVVVATTPQPFAAVAAWMLATIRRTPFILEVADIWPASIVGVGAMRRKNILISVLEKLELFLYHRATAIILLTSAFKYNLVSRGVISDKMTVVINGVDLTKYSPIEYNNELAKRHQLSQKNFIVGYIGTHGMAHALMNVLYTAEILLEHRQICFIFVGTGAERELLIRYAELKNIHNVKFIPTQPKNIISHFWSICDVALVHLKNNPVFSEVIPSKIFEAMGMGLPILLSAPKGEASAIITQDNIGLWVPPEDPDALAKAIHYFYEHPIERRKLAENSRQRAYFYSREKQAHAMLSVMQKWSRS